MEENLFRSIPRVDELLGRDELKVSALPPVLLRESVREELDALRDAVRGGLSVLPETGILCARILARAEEKQLPTLRSVINATGVTLHTNLGRACLSERAANAAAEAARDYSTLEYDVENGCRGSRYQHVEALLCRLTGAEAAMAVNNNAAAVLLVLAAHACGKEVIVSRGELVEVGGSFRIPDIMAASGAKLVEEGSTNRTHLGDYRSAITPNTAMILNVHPSNYRIEGFHEEVSAAELSALAHEHGLLLYEDQGSGALLTDEVLVDAGEKPTSASLCAGVDVVSCSGDKLLGGPQAGLIVGKREYIERIKKHPLARALRLDKMTLAALHATLSAYLDAEIAVREIPTLAMLSASEDKLHAKALRLQKALADTGVSSQLVWTGDAVGGGSAPAQELTGWAVAIEPGRLSVDELEEKLRLRAKPIVARIHRRQYLLCVRTIREEDFAEIAAAAAEAIR